MTNKFEKGELQPRDLAGNYDYYEGGLRRKNGICGEPKTTPPAANGIIQGSPAPAKASPSGIGRPSVSAAPVAQPAQPQQQQQQPGSGSAPGPGLPRPPQIGGASSLHAPLLQQQPQSAGGGRASVSSHNPAAQR